MRVLVVVDMQNDFIDGALGTAEAVKIVPKVKAKIQQYLDNKDTVVYTKDTHEENYLETAEGKKLPVPHCIKGTDGWQLSKEINVPGLRVIEKPSFGSLDLLAYLITLTNVESIELVGLCTDICVISNALMLKAYFHEIPLSVDSSCCAGVTPESHENALKAMTMCQIDIK